MLSVIKSQTASQRACGGLVNLDVWQEFSLRFNQGINEYAIPVKYGYISNLTGTGTLQNVSAILTGSNSDSLNVSFHGLPYNLCTRAVNTGHPFMVSGIVPSTHHQRSVQK